MPGGLSEPKDVIPTKKRPRSSTPDTGDLRSAVLQEVLADQTQMPLQTANRKFKFIEGDWFVRMPVSYSTSMHQKVCFLLPGLELLLWLREIALFGALCAA